ncbi:hypothetical protein KSF_077900 [Reticulibacter mediterranei]|uniref:Uncharacterized protein n=1 Tax=Reticulibacter mediterranei TaxID=2778369 RepID=A0A8J3N804_9CHLR|nr:hypothetical protein [Reticulibacter mediterranei]GHO97742.1 hypothetical protein KSF_077900 [Reticulibacter mediterranei]
MPKRPIEGTSQLEKRRKGEEPETGYHSDATRFGRPASREGQGSSAERFHDTIAQEGHEKIVNYAQYLGLEEIGPHSTEEEILKAVNDLSEENGRGKINEEELRKKAEKHKLTQEYDYQPESSSEGEPFDDDINHIVTLHLREMNDEQRAIYAEGYEIDVDEVEEHWNSKHQKRVNYAERYTDDVTFADPPLEVLAKVNQKRIWALTDLDELDAKAAVFDRVGERNYLSDEDDRAREDAMQQIINNLPRSDTLAPRNSTTWRQAQEEYRRQRGM